MLEPYCRMQIRRTHGVDRLINRILVSEIRGRKHNAYEFYRGIWEGIGAYSGRLHFGYAFDVRWTREGSKRWYGRIVPK